MGCEGLEHLGLSGFWEERLGRGREEVPWAKVLQWLELPWQKVRDSVEVKLFAEDGELYVLAKSQGRCAKERAIRRRKLVRLLWKLRDLRRKGLARDQLLLRIGAAKKDAGRAFGFVRIRLPQEGEEVTRETFSFRLDKEKLEKAELRDGHYLLRSKRVAEDPSVLWERYIQLTQIEAAFKVLKSELGLRPIYHQVEKRVEAHIFVAFQAYALSVTWKQRLQILAPGLTPRAAFDSNARCLLSHDGRARADYATLHAAGTPIRCSCCLDSDCPCPTSLRRESSQRNQSRPPRCTSKCSVDLGDHVAENRPLMLGTSPQLRKSG
ncbi:MAG: hypothetical protein ACREP9_06140 [Candidatus Dormibacteraceae bacterium]